VFVRHGQSAGNAGLRGVVEKGSLLAYKDGELTKEGERQASDFAAGLEKEQVEQFVLTRIWLTSPLSRAIATTVIVLADVCRRASVEPPAVWPKVKVIAELREKVKSDSDRPGHAQTVLEYISRVAAAKSQALFGRPDAMDSVVESIRLSYEAERRESGAWTPEPHDAPSFISMIGRFKQRLARMDESVFLIFGHSGWARFAFAGLLPAADGEEDTQNNLIDGARKAVALRNCDAILVSFKEMMFTAESSDRLTNFRAVETGKRSVSGSGFVKHHRKDSGIVASVEEAKASGIIPKDGDLARVTLLKQQWLGTFRKRLFTLSKAQGQAHLSWADKWGKPRGHVQLCSAEGCIVVVSERDHLFRMVDKSGKRRTFKMKAENEDDFDQFQGLLKKYQPEDMATGEVAG